MTSCHDSVVLGNGAILHDDVTLTEQSLQRLRLLHKDVSRRKSLSAESWLMRHWNYLHTLLLVLF